jgi:hypothetical protein
MSQIHGRQFLLTERVHLLVLLTPAQATVSRRSPRRADLVIK